MTQQERKALEDLLEDLQKRRQVLEQCDTVEFYNSAEGGSDRLKFDVTYPSPCCQVEDRSKMFLNETIDSLINLLDEKIQLIELQLG